MNNFKIGDKVMRTKFLPHAVGFEGMQVGDTGIIVGVDGTNLDLDKYGEDHAAECFELVEENMMSNIDTLEKKYAELGDEIKKLKLDKAIPESIIDFSKIPEGTLVSVEGRKIVRHFSHCDADNYYCFSKGVSPLCERSFALPSGIIRLADNPPQPWFGGECPLPVNVKVRFWMRDASDKGDSGITSVQSLNWKWKGLSGDVIAYQILESNWQD